MDNRHVVEDFQPSWRKPVSEWERAQAWQVTPEQMWDRFIEHYARKHGHVDKKTGTITMKNFIGGIEGYKKEFLEAQKGQ